MSLSADQFRRYQRDGYVSVPRCLSTAEVAMLKDEIEVLASTRTPGMTLEKDGRTIRALHGCHLNSQTFATLTRLRRFVAPAMRLLSNNVYVYQFKVHFKAAFSGDGWKWHQDYIYWHNEDGMPTPAALNILLFLDEVTEFNGPMMMVCGSHRHGLIDVTAAAHNGNGEPAWLHHVSADLKYSLTPDVVARLAREGKIVAPKGPPGTGVFFDPNIAHASGPNLSPFGRTTIIITYNSVTNVPRGNHEPRPEFLVSRNTQPIEMTADGLLA